MSEVSDLLMSEFHSVLSDSGRVSADVSTASARDEGVMAFADVSGGGGISGIVAGDGGSSNAASSPGHVGSATQASVGGTGSSVLSDAAGFAESLLGPIPSIISDITSLFGGGGTKSLPEFLDYEKPASIDFQAAVGADGSLDSADTSQYGDPRDLVASAAPLAGGAATPAAGSASDAAALAPGGSGAVSSSTPSSGHTFNNTFQISALDGQSVMDMSDQISAAVRQSLLTSGALSDVISNDLN